MKKNQNTRNYSSNKNTSKTSFSRVLRRFYDLKEILCFDEFSFLKTKNEKLQIVFANIRV